MKLLPTMGSAYSGSLRGITASHNKGGAYFRGRTVPTDPGTSYQTMMRGLFGGLSQRWTTVLTQAQRDAWDLYAQNVSWVDSLGQNIQLSGINWYVRSNAVRQQYNMTFGAGFSPLIADDAPTVFETGLNPDISEAVINGAAGPPIVFDAEFTWDNGGDYGANDLIVFYVSGPQNPGIGFFKGPYILAGQALADAGTDTVVLTDATPTATLWSDRFGSLSAGQRLFAYSRVLHEDGRLSAPVRVPLGLAPTPS